MIKIILLAHIIPTLNTGIFTMDAGPDMQMAYELVISDPEGRIIFKQLIANNKQDIQLNGLNQGLYIWQAKINGIALQNDY